MDTDNDGILDILSGCYWTSGEEGGQIQILRGISALKFSKSTALLNSADKPLQNIQFPETDAKNGMKKDQVLTICTQQHAVDYDADGDLDLIVGCFGTKFFFYENTGSAESWQLSTEPEALPVEIDGHHSNPHLVDWDGDGDLDLLSGSSGGTISWSENTGSAKKPQWAEFKVLLNDFNGRQQNLADDEEPVPGSGTRVWTYDYNQDGLLDLLVGDQSTITRLNPDLSDEERDTLAKEYQQAKQAAQEKYGDLLADFQELQKDSEADPEATAAAMKALREAGGEMSETEKLKKKYRTDTRTGFVWLYLRQPADGQ